MLDEKLAEGSSSEVNNSDKLSELRQRHRILFEKYKDQLDKAEFGSTWLSEPPVAEIVREAIHYRDNTKYDLYAYCIMPNHVHMVFKMLALKKDDQIPALTKTTQSLKSFTALKANQILNRKGQFWQHESYDRVIRNQEELELTIRYVLNNPVKANLVEEWQDWQHSFCKPEFKNDFMS